MTKRVFGTKAVSLVLSVFLILTSLLFMGMDAQAASVKPAFSIRFIDVGQADAALVQCDGKYMLIDGGNKDDSELIYNALKSEQVPKLEMVVATHAHEDNVGGLTGAYNYTTATRTLCPVTEFDTEAFHNFKAAADARGGGITVPKVGDHYSLGSATVTVVGVNGGKEPNDTSIVLRIVYGDNAFLFAADAEEAAEQVMLDSKQELSADLLKVGCHGGDTSTTAAFLKEVSPKYAVLSVSSVNRYGHPMQGLLNRLKQAGIKTFRTDLQGDIVCTSDGTTLSFTVSKNADADVFVKGTKSSEAEQQSSAAQATAPKTTTPAQSSSSAGTTAPAVNEQGATVWIPQSGKKYHCDPGCSNMKNPSHVTLQTAIANGYTACKKCY